MDQPPVPAVGSYQMSGHAHFPVRSLTQIAFAKGKLPFVRHAAKVGISPQRHMLRSA